MAVRHESLSDDAAELQAGLDRSWAGARQALEDEEFRARLEQSIASLNESTTSTTLTRDELLSLTEPAPE